MTIVYQDDFLLVIDKPPGLVVTPSETQKEPTLADLLQSELGITAERGGLVHRLDKDTSGLILVAKNNDILAQLQDQFKERSVKKEYLALVHGWLEETTVVDGAIGRNPGNREKFIVLEEGREASTEFVPVQKYLLTDEVRDRIFESFNKIQKRKMERSGYGRFTLVTCHPLTGRTHQIRVHLKHLNLPLAGDDKYGGRRTSRLDDRWIPRQFLHAAKLEFEHPVTKERVSLESHLPSDLQQALTMLTEV